MTSQTTSTGPDFECTWWPDEWFGISINACCVEHDLGSTDLDLFWCVADQHPLFFIIGAVMLLGLNLGGRALYHAVKRRK